MITELPNLSALIWRLFVCRRCSGLCAVDLTSESRRSFTEMCHRCEDEIRCSDTSHGADCYCNFRESNADVLHG